MRMVTIREASKNFRLKRKYQPGGLIPTPELNADIALQNLEPLQYQESLEKQKLKLRDVLNKQKAGETLTDEETAMFDKYNTNVSNWEKANGVLSNVAVGMLNTADSLVMGDKNFSPQSAGIDAAVHGTSSALLKSGNPIAAAVGAGLEGLNFLTKAGGQTVEGYSVDINNQGYGMLNSMDSFSSRNFLGLGNRNVKRKLLKRNEQARMALNAAAISEDQEFNNIAANNSIENVIRQNQVALAGGIDTSLLAN